MTFFFLLQPSSVDWLPAADAGPPVKKKRKRSAKQKRQDKEDEDLVLLLLMEVEKDGTKS